MRSKHLPNIVYGKNAVYEALRAGRRKVHKIILAEELERIKEPLAQLIRQRNCPYVQSVRAELDQLTEGALHQNCVALVDPYPEYQLFEVFEDPSPKKMILVVDCVQDPQNFGTLCRSALAFGVREVIVPKDRSVTITTVVCKASSGAVEHLKVIFVTNLVRAMNELKKKGFWVYGASLEPNSESLTNVALAEKSAIVVGSEGQGLRHLVAQSCDVLVKIPMMNHFDSLNVAQAGTIFMYEFCKQHSIFS